MNTLTTDEFNELLAQDGVSVFPSLYALSAYETDLNVTTYDRVVQMIYNLPV